MRCITFAFGVLGLVIVLAAAVQADNSGRIYGKIYTVDGDEFEGLIRWDKNEVDWIDVLSGTKDREDSERYDRKRAGRKKYHRNKSSFRIFGIELSGGDDVYINYLSSASSGICFGHISVMDVVGDDCVILRLKSGKDVELCDGSTDIGVDIREIVIEDLREGEVEFVWDDIEKIEFFQAPGNEKSSFGERLYGTLTTKRGDEFTGFVCWDIDEVFTNDILDGDEKRRSRKIEFGKIAAIERYSSSAALVTLRSGDDMVLRGTNDVDDDNRGILIFDPGFGEVLVGWDEFDRLEFSEAPKPVRYDRFDGGRPLKGTVYTEDGDEYRGTIRWDDDEEYTWEFLDGECRDVDLSVEFEFISEIEKSSHRSATVTLWDGRQFRLYGSNDVDDDNRGVVVYLDDGDDVLIEWEDFDKVSFEKH